MLPKYFSYLYNTFFYSFDEKLQTHYYYNEDLNKTQWEHPLDHVYRELVKKARDISMQDDTCASVQVR